MHRDLRGGAFDGAQIVGGEFDRSRAEVLVQPFESAGARDGHNPRLLRQQPGQRDLGGRGVLLLRDAASGILSRSDISPLIDGLFARR